jgi:starch-binding outer membrane protein, SusD/RagB family
MMGLALALSLTACEGLTDVNAVDVIDPAALANASGATTLYAGAHTTFAEAFIAFPLSQVVVSGLIADEFISGAAQGSWAPFSLRTMPEPGRAEPYVPLQRARIAALEALRALQAYAPEPRNRIGEMHALVGYVSTFLGENMCSGIPLSTLVNQEPVFGTQLTTMELFRAAEASFDSAAANSAADSRIRNLALVGRGRALLNQGRFADAAAAVAPVPTSFRYEVEIGATSSINYNGVYYTTYLTAAMTTVDREGVNGLNYLTAGDPRVVFQPGATTAAGPTRVRLSRYGTPNAPVELASGIEARLIAAEAAFQANPDDGAPTGSGWLGVLNDLRSTAIQPALPPLADPGTRTAREDLIFRERAFWTFGTGRRHGDLRRLIRQYGRPADSVFPGGISAHNVPYGPQFTLAPNVTQFNNPNYSGCLHRNP